MFIFRKQHSLHRLRYCSLQCAAVFKVLPKKVLCLLPVTSLRRYLRQWDGGRKEGTFVRRKVLNSKLTAATKPEVSKKCQTMFFQANTIKKGLKNGPSNCDVHAKHHFFMTNHFEKGHISGVWPEKFQPGNPALNPNLKVKH